MSTSSASRTRRYRARLAGLPDPAPLQPCPQCGRLMIAELKPDSTILRIEREGDW